MGSKPRACPVNNVGEWNVRTPGGSNLRSWGAWTSNRPGLPRGLVECYMNDRTCMWQKKRPVRNQENDHRFVDGWKTWIRGGLASLQRHSLKTIWRKLAWHCAGINTKRKGGLTKIVLLESNSTCMLAINVLCSHKYIWCLILICIWLPVSEIIVGLERTKAHRKAWSSHLCSFSLYFFSPTLDMRGKRGCSQSYK